MAKLAWGEWRPDVNDLASGQFTRFMRNVLPRADGYGPIKGIAAFTQALPAACRGYFTAKSSTDGSVFLFAGTSTKLYLLNNTTLAWTDVSLGAGTYSTIDADANWSFAQYNTIVVASQRNAVMQQYTIGVSSAFANLAGSPPQSGWIAIVGQFLVAGDILSTPQRVQWSAIGDVTGWTAGTALSDYQDLPDSGRVRAIGEIAGDVGLILQDNGFRRMVFAPGSSIAFQIERIRSDMGILAPWSLALGSGFAFFLSTKGFCKMGPDGSTSMIGEEKVDRSFLGLHESVAHADLTALAYDNGQPQLVQGVTDPKRNLYFCVYKSQSGNSGMFDRGMVYHWTLKRWAPVLISGEYMTQLSRPGLTLEGLDAIAPGALTITGAADNGSGLIRITVASTATLTTGDVKAISGVAGTTEANGNWTITVISGTTFDLQGSTFANAYVSGGVVGGSLDDLPFSLDEVSTASLPTVAAFNSDHKLGLLSGDTLEARLETAEQAEEGFRMNVNGIRPITDAATVYGSVVTRDNLNDATPDEGTEELMDSDGYCPLLGEGRYVRGRVRIPAATLWNFASGIEADAARAGMF